jgi:hypothetical protein
MIRRILKLRDYGLRDQARSLDREEEVVLISVINIGIISVRERWSTL